MFYEAFCLVLICEIRSLEDIRFLFFLLIFRINSHVGSHSPFHFLIPEVLTTLNILFLMIYLTHTNVHIFVHS